MSSTIVIAKKELRDFFYSPVAYIFLTLFLAVTFWLFFSGFFVQGQANLRNLFGLIPMLFLVFLPTITMSRFSDEKKSGTLELLFTLPITDSQIVFGKFFACFFFLLIALACTLTLPMVVWLLGDLDWGPVWGGYLGLLLFGGSAVAVGLYFSSLTQNAIVAFITAFFVLFLAYIFGENAVQNQIPQVLAAPLIALSPNFHMQSLARGLIDSRDVVYFLSVTILFLCGTIFNLGRRKWD